MLAERERQREANMLRHFDARLEQYTAAVKSSSLEPTAAALSKLNGLFEKDPKLATILSAPTLSTEDKSAIVAELEKNTGATGETVKNFLRTLAENNRLSLLGGVCSKFSELISAAQGNVEMTVTSATVRPSGWFLGESRVDGRRSSWGGGGCGSEP